MLLVRDVAEGRAVVREIAQRVAQGGHVHLVGAAGFGMAGLAVHLRARGLIVSGCDEVENAIARWLTSLSIPFVRGHDAAHVESADWVVRSTAIPDGCPDIVAARSAGKPVWYRGYVLPALLLGYRSIAVSGTHGKTTVSAMIAHVLAETLGRPHYCIGGEVPHLGGVAGTGTGKLFVVEADESDGTVLLYEPAVSVITNVEFDHMEHFETAEKLEECFEIFARSAGEAVIYCADDPRAARIAGQFPNAISYGFSPGANFQATVLRQDEKGVVVFVRDPDGKRHTAEWSFLGAHNVQNATAAITVGWLLGIPPLTAARALQSFVPVKRRFETVAQSDNWRVVTDYGHHPTEIRAVLSMAKLLPYRRRMVIFQPHRYTRTLALGKEFPPAFVGADEVVLVPVYPAAEAPIPGGTTRDLLGHFQRFGQIPVRYFETLEEAWQYLQSSLRDGDLWIVLGAGDVEQIAVRARERWGVNSTSEVDQ